MNFIGKLFVFIAVFCCGSYFYQQDRLAMIDDDIKAVKMLKASIMMLSPNGKYDGINNSVVIVSKAIPHNIAILKDDNLGVSHGTLEISSNNTKQFSILINYRNGLSYNTCEKYFTAFKDDCEAIFINKHSVYNRTEKHAHAIGFINSVCASNTGTIELVGP